MIVAFARDKGPEWQAATAVHVCDAEAEARAAALDEAIAAVEALPGMNGRRDAIGGALEVSRSAVLEALRGKR